MAFLSFSSALFSANTVIPAYIEKLYHSSLLIGIVTSILMGLPAVTQIFFALFFRTRRYKKPYLIAGILVRAAALFLLSVSAFFISEAPLWGIVSMIGSLSIFATTGSFAGIAYMDLLGKTIPRGKRYYFFPVRQIAAGAASFAGGLTVRYMLGALSFPESYGTLFLMASVSLAAAILFFPFVKEPPSEIEPKASLAETARSIPSLFSDRRLLWYITLQILSGLYLMVLPFYTVYTVNRFGNVVGNLVVFQVLGMVTSNVLWGIVSKRHGNSMIARIGAALAAFTAVSAAFLPSIGWYYAFFFLTGTALSARGIFMDAYLIEIAPEKKRVMYVGISGTVGFVGSLFPIFGGIFVGSFGFLPTFVLAFAGLSAAFAITFKLG